MKSTSNAGRLRSGDDNGKAMRGGLHSSRDLKHKTIIHLRNLDTPRCSLSGTCKRDSQGQPGQDTPMPCDSPVLIDACVHVLQTPAMRRRSGVQSDCACNRDDPRADAATGMGALSACLAMAAGQLQCSHALQHCIYIGTKMQTQAVAPAPSRRIRALTCLPTLRRVPCDARASSCAGSPKRACVKARTSIDTATRNNARSATRAAMQARKRCRAAIAGTD